MRRFNFIDKQALFTTTINKRHLCKNKNFNSGYTIMRRNIKTVIENIHDVNFSGVFLEADIENLRSCLKKFSDHQELLKINLELEKNVFELELKQKYYALCLRFHPDCTGSHALKSEIFKLVNDAYEKLRDTNFSLSLLDTHMSFFRREQKRQSQFHESVVSGKSLFSLGKNKPCTGIAVSLCGQYIAATSGNEGKIVVFDTKINRLKQEHFGNYYAVTNLAFSSDAKKIAFSNSSASSLTLLTLETGECIESKGPPYIFKSMYYTGYIVSISRLRNGSFLSVSGDNSLKIWGAETGTYVCTLDDFDKDACNVILIPNTEVIIYRTQNKTIKLWNINTRSCEGTLFDFNDPVSIAALSPDAKYLVLGSINGRFAIWDFTCKRLIKQFEGYEYIQAKHRIQCLIQGILISTDNHYFASIANSPVVKIWEMESGAQVGEKTLPAYPRSMVRIGENILIGLDNGTIGEFTFLDFGYECMYPNRMLLR
ncbi:MAG: DnaJ domain-containing protein [Gammaproteobacteria bacterium]|nr:DnaJ domain-containing protein [Gammaproteobacteria bacterium]